MNQTESNGIPNPKEEQFRSILNKLEIEHPEPFSGEWNERVENLLDGEFFLGELTSYVNRPIIVDNIASHDLRREWRKWAYDNVENFQNEYEANSLRLNHIMKLIGIIDMLIDFEEESGNITPEEIALLRDTSDAINEATKKLPGKFDSFTIKEAFAEILHNLIAEKIIPDNVEIDEIYSELTAQLQEAGNISVDENLDNKVGDIKADIDLGHHFIMTIKKYLKDNTDLTDEQRNEAGKKVTAIFRVNVDGPSVYETGDYTIEQKVELVHKINDNLKQFLSGFIKK